MKSFKKHKINKRTNKIKKAEEVNKLLDYDEESEFSEDLQIRQMRQELRRVKYNYRFVSALYSTIGTMLVVAAIAVLIANLWLPVPPIEEQKQIVTHITEKTSKIDKLIANINKEIDGIKEFKQRLISDVVTGQIKVC